ncbi:hypothetical protein Nepgr_018766 [Nepenthes gracilis]|uniref:Uncharacterized protein n=1 Tax=Nepenthes gracilis TaxID=150966 RepID=A0AAD3SS33_NEPGR|nr:hypothetical protein Nepgr_018766 [Nepenthes gracilis]
MVVAAFGYAVNAGLESIFDVVELSSFCALSSLFGRNGSLPVSFSLANRLALDQMLDCVIQVLLLSVPVCIFLRILQRGFADVDLKHLLTGWSVP